MRTLAIILLTTLATLWPLPMAVPIAQAAEPCMHVGYGQVRWVAEVRGERFTSCIGGFDLSDTYLDMAIRQDAAYAYSNQFLHEILDGGKQANGMDKNVSVKPSEVRVISVQRRK